MACFASLGGNIANNEQMTEAFSRIEAKKQSDNRLYELLDADRIKNIEVVEYLTIYNVYVPMENQEQCDRMKQLCIDNVLSISTLSKFMYLKSDNCKDCFRYSITCASFNIWDYVKEYTQVTEEQFIQLLKNR